MRATANSREWVWRAGSPHFCADACTLAATRLMLSVCSHGPTHGSLMLACCRCAAACAHVISHRARRQAAWGICRGDPSCRSPSDGQPNRACVFMFVGRLWSHSVELLPSEVGKDPVHSARYGRQRKSRNAGGLEKTARILESLISRYEERGPRRESLA